ncbi:hypothetical protein Herbaro_09275 [Herbaspirillum sp. WKF16]|uniref:hypothetical protein n=1 Tax=Herbaspirillum sp. WKF16 TaxID=3028312 RepID=UPI0023A9A760|nr:hypothetical protein [Herbaspirillum sp. WKF16]WDZ97951.1 hypothetical protein Herbaro_09275 [Herbaspirillum sp. WKF16]
MNTTTQAIQPAHLPTGAFLLTDSYKPENIPFALWVSVCATGWSLAAVTLPGSAVDLTEALDERFLEIAQENVEWQELSGRRAGGTDALVMTRRELEAA